MNVAYYTNTIYTQQNCLVSAEAVSSSCSDDVIVLSPYFPRSGDATGRDINVLNSSSVWELAKKSTKATKTFCYFFASIENFEEVSFNVFNLVLFHSLN